MEAALQDTHQQPGDQFPGLRGCVKLALKHAKTGEVVWQQEVKNSPATAGLAWLWAHALSGEGASSQVIGFMGVGTDATAPDLSDTALGSEVARKAIAAWDTSGLTATDGPYFMGSVEFATNEANTTLAECGFFNSSAVGTIIAHATFATTDKTTDYVLGISYTITQNVS